MNVESRESLENMLTPPMDGRVAAIRESWQNVAYEQVVEAAGKVEIIEPSDNLSKAIILEPDGPYIDESRSLVIVLPHLNGWTPHHFIRAKITQQLVAPDSRVVILPNNSLNQQSYDLSLMTKREHQMLEEGNIAPFGMQQVRTLANVNKHVALGSLGVTGYGFAGLVALSIAANNNDTFNITHVNADEVPSKLDRSSSRLRFDRLRSGGPLQQYKCVKESEIPALGSALRPGRISRDLAKFVLKSQTDEGSLMEAVMSGSARSELIRACNGKRLVKIGYIEGSKIFDLNTLGTEWRTRALTALVLYGGPGFRGHTSGENLINYALMAEQGLK